MVLCVESAKFGREAEGTRGNQGIEKTESMRKVQTRKIGHRSMTIDSRWPDDRKCSDQMLHVSNLSCVLRPLDQFHND